jgi:hypothetical protein
MTLELFQVGHFITDRFHPEVNDEPAHNLELFGSVLAQSTYDHM